MMPLILFTAITVIGIIGIIGTVEYSHADHDPHPEFTVRHHIINCTSIQVEVNLDKEINVLLFQLITNSMNNWERYYPNEVSYFNHTHTITIPKQYHTEQWIQEPASISVHASYDRIKNHNINGTYIHNLEGYVYQDYIIDYSQEHEQLCIFHKNQTPSITTELPKTRLQLANEKIETLETQLNDLQTRYNNLQSQPRSNPIELDQTKSDLSNLQTRYNRLETQYNALQTQHSTLQIKTDDLMNKVNTKSDTKNLWKERFNTCFDKKEKLKSTVENITTELNQCKLDIVNEQNQCTQLLDDHESQLESYRQQITNHTTTITEKQDEIDQLKQQLLEAENRIRELES